MSKLLRGKNVAGPLLQQAKKIAGSLPKRPKVALVRVGSAPAAKGYQKSAAKVLERVGITPEPYIFDSQINFSRFKREIQRLNTDDLIDAILLLDPLPPRLPLTRVQDLLSPKKDIDGITRTNLGRTLSPRTGDLVPLTAGAVMELLKFYEIRLTGAQVVLIGASLAVGKPLANLLLHKHATLTVCDEYTDDVSFYTRKADVVVTAVGHPKLLTAEMVKNKAVVIDVGTNYTSSGKLVGDVDFEKVSKKVRAITPVPGGIGAITTALLAYRAARVAENFTSKKK